MANFYAIFDEGKSSEFTSKAMGVEFKTRSAEPYAEDDVERVEVPGRVEGSLTRKLGLLDVEQSFQVEIRAKGAKAFDLMDALIAKLYQAETVRLSDRNYFRYIKDVSIGEAENDIREILSFTISLTLEPLKYMTGNTSATISNSGDMITNPGTYEAAPLLTVYGAGEVSVTINGKKMIVTGLSDYVKIDTKTRHVYRGVASFMNKASGDFPTIPTGAHAVTWTGGVTRIEIEGRWRKR